MREACWWCGKTVEGGETENVLVWVAKSRDSRWYEGTGYLAHPACLGQKPGSARVCVGRLL
jgi:hypothetical protein